MHLSQYYLHPLADFNQIWQWIPIVSALTEKETESQDQCWDTRQAMPVCTTMVLHTKENQVKAFT